MATIDLVFRDALVVDGSRRASRIAPTSPSTPAASSASDPSSRSGRERSVDADGLALMPGHHRQPHPLRRPDHLGPDVSPSPALGVTTAVIGNCGFTIAPCRPRRPRLTMRNLTQVEGMSLDVLRQGIAWELRDLSRVPRAARDARVECGQRRRLRRPPRVRTYVMGDDASRRAATRRRDRADAGHRARSDAAGAVGFASSTSARRTTARAACRCPRAWPTTREMRRWSRAMGEGGRGVYMLTKGGHTPVPFLESLAADTGRPGDGRRAAAQQRQSATRCSTTSTRSPPPTRAATGCSARSPAAR